MIIDRNAGVTPNRYQSSELRRTIGRRIGRADRDDMLRALLWVSEVRMAGDLTDAWREFHGTLDRETKEAERRRDRGTWALRGQVGVKVQAVARELAGELWSERYEAKEALDECKRIAGAFEERLGLDHGEGSVDQRAALTVLGAQLESAKDRLASLIAKDREQLHQWATLEQGRIEAEARGGVTLDQLDRMDQTEFDDVIQAALERFGCQVTRSAPAVLEVDQPHGGSFLVICINSSKPAYEERTSVEQIVKAQRLIAERAAAKVIMISNLRFFSPPARRLYQEIERESEVRLITRFELEQWVAWGLSPRLLLGMN
ncbi:restriction endonuclease [Streptomyces hydrogenans]